MLVVHYFDIYYGYAHFILCPDSEQYLAPSYQKATIVAINMIIAIERMTITINESAQF
jgi:hypothetical protein